MRKWIVTALVLTCGQWGIEARAVGERSGDFDYYVMSLSWSPTWCAQEGEARKSPQCDQDFGWVLHGLWPQYENGWPEYCTTVHRDPTHRETQAMADIMGTSGLAWYQWKKHGRCTGVSADAFFQHARDAFESVTRPAVFRALERDVRLPASVVEDAFLKDNPTLTADGVTVTCKSREIQEVRICLSKDLAPRTCGPDVIRDCTLDDALLRAIDH